MSVGHAMMLPKLFLRLQLHFQNVLHEYKCQTHSDVALFVVFCFTASHRVCTLQFRAGPAGNSVTVMIFWCDDK